MVNNKHLNLVDYVWKNFVINSTGSRILYIWCVNWQVSYAARNGYDIHSINEHSCLSFLWDAGFGAGDNIENKECVDAPVQTLLALT